MYLEVRAVERDDGAKAPLDADQANRDGVHPLLRSGLAFDAGRAGETAPAWLSAANEVAVEAFLAGGIAWVDIAEVVDASLQRWPGSPADDVAAVLEADRSARDTARAVLAARMQ